MTSIRALWLLDSEGTVLLSRRYATVERRVRRRHQISASTDTSKVYLSYDSIAIPNDETFSAIFQNDFLNHFRHGSSPSYPVISLGGQKHNVDGTSDKHSSNSLQQELWPVIAVYHHGAFLVAIPEVDGFLIAQYPSDRPPAVQLPSVTATFALLDGLAPFIERASSKIFSTTALAKLQCHLCSIMPFGTPIETNLTIIDSSMKATRGTYPQKRPAWKPEVLSNMRQSLDITVKETVSVMVYGRQRSVRNGNRSNKSKKMNKSDESNKDGNGEKKRGVDQGNENDDDSDDIDSDTNDDGDNGSDDDCSDGDDDNSNGYIQDVCHVRGTIACNSKLNGVPEVSLVISTSKASTMDSDGRREDAFPAVVLVHECVLPPSTISSRQIIFSPPVGKFNLARYSYRNDARGHGSNSNSRSSRSGGRKNSSGGGKYHNNMKIPVRALYQVEPIITSSEESRMQTKHGISSSNNIHGEFRNGDGQQYDIRLHLRWGMDISVQENAIVKEFEAVLPFGGHIIHHTLTTTTGTLKTIDEVIDSNDNHSSRSNGYQENSENIIRTKLIWSPGSKFKDDGADAILTGTITMAPITTPRPKSPEVLMTAPDLVSGMCTGDCSPVPLSNQMKEIKLHQNARHVEKLMIEHKKNEKNEKNEKNDIMNENVVEPNLQKKNSRKDWKSYAEFVKDNLDSAEMGGDVMDRSVCYAEIHFKIQGYSLSGTHVNRHSVAVQPSASAAINTSVELNSGKYIIWNRWGDCRYVTLPKEKKKVNICNNGGSESWV